ncbi:MAG: hypothetical protein Q8M98_04790 [Candidatus Cloacimonadaceae bacterium]|nr:hypothetical protein [Candidatus Cloacimonadaceae bacterium]
MTKEQRERYLRQDIHGLRVKKFRWTEEELKGLLKYLGLGDSLTALDELTLTELKLILMRVRLTNKPDEYTYDKQGMYMHSLMLRAKWDEHKLRTFMITHYRKSHWNLLDMNERKAVIAMLQNYIKKAAIQASKQENENRTDRTENQQKENSHGNHQHPQG